MSRDKIFISYSHKDKTLFEEFRNHLGYWSEGDQVQVWSDKDLKTSEHWQAEIQKALDSAAVAVLLISPDFLNSEFIRAEELPILLGAREDGQHRCVDLLQGHARVVIEEVPVPGRFQVALQQALRQSRVQLFLGHPVSRQEIERDDLEQLGVDYPQLTDPDAE